MLPESSIIIVDNEESELNQLSKAFSMSGIPCLPLLYDSRNGVDSYNLKPSINIRWLFMDLNLEDSTENTAAAYIGPIKHVIEKLVCGGIYTLIFWSKHSNIINDIIERIKKDENLKREIHCPVMIYSLDKTSLFLDSDLENKIKEILKSPPLIKSIYSWERLVTDSVSRVLDNTYKLANINNSWDTLNSPDNDNNWKDEITISNIENVVSLLAYESTGFKSAPEIKEKSFNNGLFSLVENEYDNISDNHIWDKSTLIGHKDISLDQQARSNLNTYLSIDEVDYSNDIKIMFNKGVLTFINDKEKFIKKILGNDNCINEEFSAPNKQFSRDNFEKIIIGALEISPDCDHANKKIKLPRFILSVLIPDNILKDNNRSQKYHDGIFSDLPPIIYNNTSYKLLVSYKYLFSIHNDAENLDILFSKKGIRIKQNILSKIRLEMSRHISRLGYISIH
ncbi:hypothetical protein [Proteus columbae]|uniref:hypothetical protein n=1 Tax=Proteus columbae TaxID=1987580 RepID=UPI00288C0580|nr:hypothetical protein [Proteus columbae]